MGLHDYKSPARVWREKMGIDTATEPNDRMLDGLDQEPAADKRIRREFPRWAIQRSNVYVRDTDLRIGATPDLEVFDLDRPGFGVVDTKVPLYRNYERDWLSDPLGAPIYYRVQVIVQAKLLGASWAALAAYMWVPQKERHELHIVDVEIDEELWQRAVSSVAEFWADFDRSICPPIDPAKDSDLIKAIWPTDDGSTIDLSADNRVAVLVDERMRLKAVAKDIEKDVNYFDTEIRDKMGAHTYGLLADGRRIQLKTVTKEPYTVTPKSYREMRILKNRSE